VVLALTALAAADHHLSHKYSFDRTVVVGGGEDGAGRRDGLKKDWEVRFGVDSWVGWKDWRIRDRVGWRGGIRWRRKVRAVGKKIAVDWERVHATT